MQERSNIAVNKKPNFARLLEYGFVNQNGVYTFSTDILHGDFQLFVYATSNKTNFKVIDTATEDEYILLHMPEASGAFVGTIRKACAEVINDILDKCYEVNMLKSKYAHLIIKYVAEKYKTRPEYLWKKFPDYAVFRDSRTQKWYAIILTIKKRKLGINEDGAIEIINLKETSENIADIVDNKNYFAGYHMNKRHWYTIKLDGSVNINEIYKRIDISLNLLTKK